MGKARSVLLARKLVVDAFDVEIHTENLAVVEVIAAFALDRLAVLPNDRALERMQLARDDRGLGILKPIFTSLGMLA